MLEGVRLHHLQVVLPPLADPVGAAQVKQEPAAIPSRSVNRTIFSRFSPKKAAICAKFGSVPPLRAAGPPRSGSPLLDAASAFHGQTTV